MENTTATGMVLTWTAPEGKDPLGVLADVVSSIESVERVLARVQAVREGLLVMASKVAELMMPDGGAPAGFAGAGWDSRAAELAERAVAAEIAAAARMSDRTVQRQMGQAVELVSRFPLTFGALSEGRISLAHARVIQDAGTRLADADARAGYEEAVVGYAERQAPGRVRRLAVLEAEKAQCEPLTTRHERAREERRVWVNPLPDGMAELGAVLPAVVAYGIHDRLTQMAHAYSDAHAQPGAATRAGAAAGSQPDGGADCPLDQGHTPAQHRSVDQLRADLLADLMLRGTPTGHDTPDGVLAAIMARVDVTVPAKLLEAPRLSDCEDPADTSARVPASRVPAELEGRHPIDTDTARLLAGAAAGWNRVLTDPDTGNVLAVDRYRPSENLRRLLRARDSRCRFPGCGIKARELDLDHTLDAALGGPTEPGNLAGLCRRHHMLKHHSQWTLRQAAGGVLEWTSPTGRKYTDQPPTPATFTARQGAEPDPPPF